MKVKEKLPPDPKAVLENFPPSLTMECEAESRFVQVTVVPLGTVTEAGRKRKLSMVTATGAGGTGVVGAPVRVVAVAVVAMGVVAAGRGVVVTVGTGVVPAGVTGGAVVVGVAWVVTWGVTGDGPEGVPVHPARRTAHRRTAPMKGHKEREIRILMGDSSRDEPSPPL
ncbi:MAG: hypothetical protein LUQ49_02585 [Methanomicrobiales archaeon]|nr:hypothetical protein [Methanomicrobiales archaeon]